MRERRCACPLWNSGDARGCLEVREYGHTPVLQHGDVLDGVIVVELLAGTIVSGDLANDDECECGCHLDDEGDE